MTTLPILPVKRPSAASTFPNGSPPQALLRDPGDGRGDLLIIPSYGMQALHLAARQSGVHLKTTGRGRSLAQQIALQTQRYDRGYFPGRADYNVWQGETWSLKPGMAMAAVPGTSNHGWYSADDLAVELDGDPGPESLTPAVLDVLVELAPKCGWAWETAKEPWHVHWIAGDIIPPFAREILDAAGVLPLPNEEPEMKAVRPPRRLLDTRKLGDPVAVDQVITLDAGTGSEAMVNFTVTDTGPRGYLVAWPEGDPPETSNVNWYQSGAIAANVALVPLAADGTFRFTVKGSQTHVVVDLQGIQA